MGVEAAKEDEKDDHICEVDVQQIGWGVARKEGREGLGPSRVVGRIRMLSPFGGVVLIRLLKLVQAQLQHLLSVIYHGWNVGSA